VFLGAVCAPQSVSSGVLRRGLYWYLYNYVSACALTCVNVCARFYSIGERVRHEELQRTINEETADLNRLGGSCVCVSFV